MIVPRQNGKGEIELTVEVEGLYLAPVYVTDPLSGELKQGSATLLHSAHEFKTSTEHFLRVKSLLESRIHLRKRIQQIYSGHGNEAIEVAGPCEDCDKFTCQHARPTHRLKFIARSRGSGRGFTVHRMMLDEAYKLTPAALAALLPTMAAVDNPLTVYGSSAPLPGEEGEALRRVMRRGRAGDPTLTYIEFSAEEDTGEEALRQANPGYGVRMNPRVAAQAKEVLDREDYEREFLGIINLDPEAAGWDVITQPEWAGCAWPASGPDGRTVFALDVSADRAWSSFVVAARSTLGGVHVELVDRLPGTDVVARAKQLVESWGGPLAIAKHSPAWSLERELEEAGVPLYPVDTGEHAQACGDLLDAVRRKEVRHLSDGPLDDAVKAAERRPYGEAWLWTRSKSAGDISPLVAATLARWVLLHQPAEEEARPVFAY